MDQAIASRVANKLFIWFVDLACVLPLGFVDGLPAEPGYGDPAPSLLRGRRCESCPRLRSAERSAWQSSSATLSRRRSLRPIVWFCARFRLRWRSGAHSRHRLALGSAPAVNFTTSPLPSRRAVRSAPPYAPSALSLPRRIRCVRACRTPRRAFRGWRPRRRAAGSRILPP